MRTTYCPVRPTCWPAPRPDFNSPDMRRVTRIPGGRAAIWPRRGSRTASFRESPSVTRRSGPFDGRQIAHAREIDQDAAMNAQERRRIERLLEVFDRAIENVFSLRGVEHGVFVFGAAEQ